MTFLPIVERELRVAARRHGIHWMRMAVALVATMIGGGIFAVSEFAATVNFGQALFWALSGLAMLYCLFSGRRSTADSLSEEKREGTLGLLFLTDLKGYDVVCGKMVATSLNAFYGLLAMFPVLAVPLLVGGMTNGEFWRMVLLLVNTFLFSLAIGIFVSALSRDSRKALGGNFLVLLLLVALPPVCCWVVVVCFAAHPFFPSLMFSCPGYAFYLCGDLPYRSAPENFWWSVGVIHGLTWLLVILASWIVPRSWQDKPAPARPGKKRPNDLWQMLSYGKASKRVAFRKQALDENAFYWLAGRARLKPLHVWIFLGLTACWWLLGWAASGNTWFDESVPIATALILNTAFKFWIALESGHRLAEDQKAGAFELLLSTPLTVKDILRGQLLALRRQFLWPLLLVITGEAIFIANLAYHSTHARMSWVWLVVLIMLIADVGALIWVGMLQGLTAKTQNRATISTVTKILVLPWVLWGLVMLARSIWEELWAPPDWTPGWKFPLGCWFAFGILVDLAFGLSARRRLQSNFRQLALQRFSPVSSRFAWWPGRRKPGGATAIVTAPEVKAEELPTRRHSRKLKFAVVIGGLLLLGIISSYLWEKSRPKLPPAVVVSLMPNKGPLRVFPGYNGVLIILPDGSLWRWGQVGGAKFTQAWVPERVGTNNDWQGASAGFSYCVGVRGDGTLWEWGAQGKRPFNPEPVTADGNHDWVQISAGASHSVALKRDGSIWTCGDNAVGQLGNGIGPGSTNYVQVGTSHDWKTVSTHGACTLGLKTDGTLWVWGRIYLQNNNFQSVGNYPVPTRVCNETNWSGLSSGFMPLARTKSGELWNPLYALPNPNGEAFTSGRLVATNSLSDQLALGLRYQPKVAVSRYEVRPDGTLWSMPLTWPLSEPVAEKWSQLGKRSDWLSVWGGGGTMLGLTADGTLWTWGSDVGQKPVENFQMRLQQFKARLSGKSSGVSGMLRPPFQENPRPLMQLGPVTWKQ